MSITIHHPETKQPIYQTDDPAEAVEVASKIGLVNKWRPHLLTYTRQRVADAQAEQIVCEVIERLAYHDGPIDNHFPLFAAAHELSGATGDWRNGLPLLVR
jgi:hypothetical protein